MKNTFTEGSEYAHRRGRPANEDYSMMMSVISAGEGIVTAEKVWDLAAIKQEYRAQAYYFGQPGVPENIDLQMEYIIFYRIGEGYDEESWVCFVSKTEVAE